MTDEIEKRKENIKNCIMKFEKLCSDEFPCKNCLKDRSFIEGFFAGQKSKEEDFELGKKEGMRFANIKCKQQLSNQKKEFSENIKEISIFVNNEEFRKGSYRLLNFKDEILNKLEALKQKLEKKDG